MCFRNLRCMSQTLDGFHYCHYEFLIPYGITAMAYDQTRGPGTLIRPLNKSRFIFNMCTWELYTFRSTSPSWVTIRFQITTTHFETVISKWLFCCRNIPLSIKIYKSYTVILKSVYNICRDCPKYWRRIFMTAFAVWFRGRNSTSFSPTYMYTCLEEN